jgi:hypothetical protein
MYSTLSLPASLGLNLYYSLPNAWFVRVVPCFQGFLNLYEITFFDVLYTCPIISSFLPGSPLYLARGQDFETYSLWNYIRSDLISSHFASNDFLGIAYIYSRTYTAVVCVVCLMQETELYTAIIKKKSDMEFSFCDRARYRLCAPKGAHNLFLNVNRQRLICSPCKDDTKYRSKGNLKGF